jgi:hypothetical protein
VILCHNDVDHDAKLYISQHLVKIVVESAPQFESGSDDPLQQVISFKYSVDFPKLDMHPLDTTRFSIAYDTCESSMHAYYSFANSLSLRALSRHTRDLISLTLKCFSAQNHLFNTNLIRQLSGQPLTTDNLLEIEQLKRELSQQVQVSKAYA